MQNQITALELYFDDWGEKPEVGETIEMLDTTTFDVVEVVIKRIPSEPGVHGFWVLRDGETVEEFAHLTQLQPLSGEDEDDEEWMEL
jgi:hypothetical protein